MTSTGRLLVRSEMRSEGGKETGRGKGRLLDRVDRERNVGKGPEVGGRSSEEGGRTEG